MGGQGLPYTMRALFKALLIGSRPKTLTASISPVLVGFCLAYRALGHLPDLTIALPLLLSAILIQVLTNFVNDLFDFKKGKDTSKRIGPTRVLQSGMISEQAMSRSIFILTSIILLLGWYIVQEGGRPILIIGILSILGAYCYTAGPYPLAYNGLGEIFVFIFFGPIAVCGTEYMLTGTYTTLGLYLGYIIGGIASALLIVNNTRDIEEDRGTGKRTLVSMFGRRFANKLFALSLLLPLLLAIHKFVGSFHLVIYLVIAGLAFFRLCLEFKALRTGQEFNIMLGKIGKVLFIFSVYLGLVVCFFV